MKNVYFNFNGSSVTLASPNHQHLCANQTSERLPRDYRKGTISSLCRNLTLLFAILTLSIANIGMAWGAEYALVSNPTGTPALTTNFRYGNLTLNKSTAATIDGIGFKKGIGFGSSLGSISGKEAGDNNIMYDVKTTSTKFTVYVSGATGTLYFSKIAEGATSTTVENKTISSNPQKIEFTLSSTTNTCVGFSVNNTSMYIYQIIAEETGTAHKQAGEAGYQLNLNKGRYAGNKASSNSGKSGSIDNIELATYDKIVCTSSSAIQLEKNSADTYVKFTTGASAVNLKVTFSAGSLIVNTTKSTSGGTSLTSNTAQALAASTTYWIISTHVSNRASITKIAFEAASGVTNPSFSPATGSSLVKSTGTVALTSSGNTVYYKWSQTDNQYSSSAGATLADAADGNGTSPVNATAPSTTGTWYLYAVAKNGGDYSDVVKATYTITNPTYTVSYNLNGGKYNGSDDAPTQAAVESGTNITMPVLAPTKADYAFVGWRCSVNSADYMPSASYTMTAANTTFTAQWATACFEVPDARKNSNPAATITASMLKGNKIAGGTLTWESANDYSGNADHGLILNEDGEQIVVTLSEGTFVAGSIITITTHGNSATGKTCGVKVSGNNMTPATYSTSTANLPFTQTYVVQAGDGIVGTNTFAIKRYNSNQVYIYSITVSGCGAPSCTAPSSVSVEPTNANGWRYSLGETIDLTCTTTGGTGTKTYQWQKYIGSSWEDIDGATNARFQKASCTSSDGGQYRCVVSTGATCSLESDGYYIRVFTLNGAYYGGSDTENAIVWTDANTGVATVHLNASSTYMFKVTDNDGRWFGNGENNYIIQPVALDCGTDNQKLRLLTGPEGDYTFTINVQHAADVSPYVNIATGYPTVSHPNSGYAYITKWWDCYVHYWEGTNNDLTAWGSDPKINSDRYVNICGTDYWYFPVIDTYNKFIAKNNAGDATDSNTTGNQETTGHGGQYITHSGSWGWHEFTTYSISFNAGGGTGTMDAIEGICPNSNQEITTNAFEKTGYTFNCWHADKAVKVGGSTIAAGGDIAGGATLQEINNDITLTAQWTAATYTLTVSGAVVDNPMKEGGKTGAISGVTITGSPVSGITSGTTTSTSDNTFTVNKGTPVTVTASASVSGSSAECDECTYVFDHWSNVPATVTANVSNIQAAYKTTYDITYHLDGGSWAGGYSAPAYYVYGVGLTLPVAANLTKSGYTFEKWTWDWDGSDISSISDEGWGKVSVTAHWTADCEQSLSKVVLTSASAGTVTGYNDKAFAGDAVIGGLSGTATAEVDDSHGGVETGYKLSSSGSAIVFATLKNTSFHAGDVVKVTITKQNDNYSFPSPVSAETGMDIYYGTNKDDATRLTTLSGVIGAGTYSYTLTASDVSTIGSKKGIGVFRHKDRAQNQHIYSVEILGCREFATVYNFANGSFNDWGTCSGGDLSMTGSQSGVSYQLYKDGVATGDPKAGTGSNLSWHVTANGTYTVRSVENATYASTPMTGSAVVTLNDPTLSGESSVEVGGTITLTHPNASETNNWESSNTSVATVSNTGVVTGVAAGSATITFHGLGACDGTKEITVTIPKDCSILITDFETSKHDKSDGKPDAQDYYLYGYQTTVDAAHALTLTTTNSNNKGQNSGVEIRVDNGSTLRIYANNVTNATPGSFEDVVSVSFDAKLYNSGSTSRTQPYTIKVGGTSVGSGSVVGLASDGYQHVSTGSFSAKDGYIDIVLSSTGSSNTNLYIDNIEICQTLCTDAGLTYALATVNKAEGAAGFTNPLTNPHGVAVEFSSTNPEVATVNATTGAVTVVGIGATEIKANSNRQKISEITYCADEANYTLAVASTSYCELLAYGIQNAAHTAIPGVYGTITTTGGGASDNYVKLTADDKYFTVKPVTGSFAAGDKVSVRVYNKESDAADLGFKIKSTSHTESIAKKSKGVIEYTLVAGDIEGDGSIKIKRSSSNDRYDAIWVERCEACDEPTVTTHPASASYNQSASASALTAVFNGQGKELSYQWYSNDENNNTTGSIISGATSNNYTPSTALIGTEYYYCVATTICGSVATNVATITINDTHPAPTAVWTGTTENPTHGGRGFDVIVAAKNAAGSAVWDGTLDVSMLSVSTGINIYDVVVDNTAKTITAKYDVTSAATNPISFTLSLPATTEHRAAALTHSLSDITLCASGGSTIYTFESSQPGNPLNTYFDITYSAGSGHAVAIASSLNSNDIKASDLAEGGSNFLGGTLSTSGVTATILSKDSYTDIDSIAFYENASDNSKPTYKFYVKNGDSAPVQIAELTHTSISNALIGKSSTANKWNGRYVIDLSSAPKTGKLQIEVSCSSSGKYYAFDNITIYEHGGAGSFTPTLGWSNSQEDGAVVEKNEDAPDFAITATRNNADAEASLGTITYSSSNTAIATVNATTGRVTIADDIDFGGATYKETTISATLTASGCYSRATITYILRINKFVCSETAGTISVKSGDACSGQILTVTGFEAGATFQWYRNGDPISGATSQDYTANVSGTYSVVTTNTCDVASTNSIVVAKETATAKKIVDEWYVKKDRRTPDIALVQTTNATGFDVSPENIGGCTFYLGDDGIIYLKGQKDNGDEPAHGDDGWTAGDVNVTITATACGNATPLVITIHKQAETLKPSIAFVVDGTDGGLVTEVNTDHTTGRTLYATNLSSEFDMTACNIYWTTNEQMLRQYYSQFDAIVITDDPNTQKIPGGKDKDKSVTQGYVNAMGTLIDVRPLLTMEAFVSRLDNWSCVKGDPSSPDPREYVMKLQCKEHAIYSNLVEDGSLIRQETVDGIDTWYVTMVDQSLEPYASTKEKAEDLPALQGFDGKVNTGMLGIGTIANDALQGGIERQKEPAARMMVLGINHDAMDALTVPGKQVIINAINYLLETDMESLEDCSNYFKGGTSGHETDWHTPTNWTSGKVPDPTVRARILAPCEISGIAKAASVDIAVGGRTSRYQSGSRDCEGNLTINASGALIVGGEIKRIETAPNFGVDNLKPTQENDLAVLADEDHNGALIFDNHDGTTKATIHFYSKAYTNIKEGKKKKHWQYFGIPIHEAPIPEYFYGAYTYVWEEPNSAWSRRGDGTTLYEWDALAISYGAEMDQQPTYILRGELTSTQNHTVSLTYEGVDSDKGYNLIGNSWTAPLQIVNFDEDDFGANVEHTVYIHNTGRKEEAGGSYTPVADNSSTPGQWISIAINAPGVPGYEGVKVIPAMQAFEVHATAASTLKLDYERLVRGVSTSDVNTPMRVPKRIAQLEDVDPQAVKMLKIQVADQKTQTSTYIFQHEGFSDMYDNGWDARYAEGNGESAVLYVTTPDGNMAMAAIPEVEGTVLGFSPGQENTYTFSFKYTGDEVLYLNDMQEETSTLINEENTYMFTYGENEMLGRFIISAQPFGIPTIITDDESVNDEAKPIKFIKDEKIFILVHGILYDATGKIVVR